ncbi:hypothetical protein HHI36_010825 [Cryptolaemus montrouzieri]
MFQILSITKRMDATEQAVLKIASFAEDLSKTVQGNVFTEEDLELSLDKPHETKDSDRSTSEKVQSHKSEPIGPPHKIPVPSETSRASTITKSHEKIGSATNNVATSSSSGSKPLPVLDLPSIVETLGESSTRLDRLEKTSRPVIMIKDDIGEEGFTEKRIKDKHDSVTRSESPTSIASEAKKPTLPGKMFQMPVTQLENIQIADMPDLEAFNLIQKELKSLRDTVEQLMKGVMVLANTGAEAQIPDSVAGQTIENADQITTKFCQIELKLNQCVEQINKMDSVFSISYNGITNKMSDIESTLKLLSNKALYESGKSDMEDHLSQSIYTINEKVLALEGVISKMSDAIGLLLEENTTKQNKIMNLLDDVDHIKSDKIGREEFTEALSEKVDLCMINRKVSHDQFNATCDDLSRGIEEALEKLMEQEDLWHVALKEIQEEINEKLGKGDLEPLKIFVSEKLNGLKQKVKTLTKLKQDQEAAATKTKFLKNVQCISCDKDVIMRKKIDESENYPGAPTLPTHKSMAPYLAYELDQMRKQQQNMHYSRNMNHFESAIRNRKGIINRYCGGTHTITTPQQRVTRIGNFIEQWTPKPEKVKENEEYGQLVSVELKTKSRESLTVRSAVKVDRAERDENKERKSFSNIMESAKLISETKEK